MGQVRLVVAKPEGWPDDLQIDGLDAAARRDPERAIAELSGEPRLLASRDLTTDTGWPLRVEIHQVAPGEHIVVARYGFFDLSAAVVVRNVPGAWLDDHREEVIAMLRGVRPAWGEGEVVEISQLWQPASD